jgi:HD-GYP domain-containing protein (c-di-GMP phosphodiesterase class II)
MSSVRAGGKLDEAVVDQAVTPLVESVLRNPDAYFWLETMRHHDSYTYSHAMNCCALMAAFGRHLGLGDQQLHDMATGGLLLDIGKTAVPEALLESREVLDAAEQEIVHGHLQHGVRLYDASGADNLFVRDIIETHHEREDGSGYPSGLAGDGIPLFGRIAGIVDSFDAMTSARPYRAALFQVRSAATAVPCAGQAVPGRPGGAVRAMPGRVPGRYAGGTEHGRDSRGHGPESDPSPVPQGDATDRCLQETAQRFRAA